MKTPTLGLRLHALHTLVRRRRTPWSGGCDWPCLLQVGLSCLASPHFCMNGPYFVWVAGDRAHPASRYASCEQEKSNSIPRFVMRHLHASMRGSRHGATLPAVVELPFLSCAQNGALSSLPWAGCCLNAQILPSAAHSRLDSLTVLFRNASSSGSTSQASPRISWQCFAQLRLSTGVPAMARRRLPATPHH